MTDREQARYDAQLADDRARIAAKHAATNPTDEPIYDAESHQRTIDQRNAVITPDVDLNDMRDITGKRVMPMTVETRCMLNLINDDQGMMGDRG